MNLNYKAIANIMSGMLIIISLCLVVPMIVSALYREESNVEAFALTAFPILLIGLIMRKNIKPSLQSLRIREGFFIVSLTWILFPVIGAVPFVMSGDIPSFMDAVFESCSGFSTTGATILTDIEAMSKGMLFWRSFSHWLGGVGVLFLAMAVIPMLYSGKQNIALESTGPSLDKTSSKFSDTARQLYKLYIGFTIAEIILLILGGMDLFDAAVHTFGSVATGGFSSYNDSIAHFDSTYIEAVIMVFMFLCGISFNLYFMIPRRGIKHFFTNSQFKLYTAIIVSVSFLITITVAQDGIHGNVIDNLVDSFFQVISIITTTGYMTYDYELWPQFAKALIFLLFFVGGCTSSTGGGIKVFRILVLLKLIKRSIGNRLHPNAVINIKIQKNNITNDVVSNVTSFVFLYIFTIVVGALLISLDNYDMITSFSAAASCLGNIGPGFNLVGPVMNYDIFSDFSKGVLSFLMIAGRLELFTFLSFFIPHFWNSDRY